MPEHVQVQDESNLSTINYMKKLQSLYIGFVLVLTSIAKPADYFWIDFYTKDLKKYTVVYK